MDLTLKEEKILQKWRKAKRNKNIAYLAFGIGIIGSIVCLAKNIMIKSDMGIFAGYFLLILTIVGIVAFGEILKLFSIIEKNLK